MTFSKLSLWLSNSALPQIEKVLLQKFPCFCVPYVLALCQSLAVCHHHTEMQTPLLVPLHSLVIRQHSKCFISKAIQMFGFVGLVD